MLRKSGQEGNSIVDVFHTIAQGEDDGMHDVRTTSNSRGYFSGEVKRFEHLLSWRALSE